MRLLSTLHPTQNQLQVIATIISNRDHPAQAASAISANGNLIAARNMLMKLNVITYSDTSAALTQQGEQLAQEQNITDETGELTDVGQKLLGNEEQPEDISGEEDFAPQQDMGEMPPAQGQAGGMPPMEGFSFLFKNLLNS